MGKEEKFAEMARVYDEHIQVTIPQYAVFFEQTLSLVKNLMPSPDRWLDTGTGTGNMAEKALAAFPETQFYLQDPSPQMLERARNKLAPNPRIHIADKPLGTQQLELETSSFDVITSIQAHHYLPKQERLEAVTNCYRFLRPGGVLVVFENIRPFSEIGIKVGLARWQQFQIAAGKPETEAIQHAKRFDTEYFPVTIDQHLELLRDVGFETVEIFWLSYMQAGFYAVK